MTKHLTQKQKADWLDVIIQRDGKFACWYCNLDFFSLSDFVFEHLNCNRKDNRVDNLVLACVTCNNKKPHDIDMQIQATDKLHLNEKLMYMRENTPNKMDRKQSNEITINVSNFEIAKLFLIRNVPIPFDEALDSISYLCREKTGHGSQQSVRNYINTLTSTVAPFEIIKQQGKKVIRYKLDSNVENDKKKKSA